MTPDIYAIASMALVFASLSLFICGVGVLLILTLLHPNDARYAELMERVDGHDRLFDLVGTAHQATREYVEALDDATKEDRNRLYISRLPAHVGETAYAGQD